jgi:hypothetical protein
MSRQRACWKRYGGANILRWNLEVKLFVAQSIVQMEEDTPELGAIEDHMLL